MKKVIHESGSLFFHLEKEALYILLVWFLTAFREGHAEEHQEVNYFHCIFETRKGQPLLLKLFKPFKSIYPFLSVPRIPSLVLKDSMNDLI